MTKVTCDMCESIVDISNQVELKGYKNPHSEGILLPEKFHKFDFCSVDFFLMWIRKQLKTDKRA